MNHCPVFLWQDNQMQPLMFVFNSGATRYLTRFLLTAYLGKIIQQHTPKKTHLMSKWTNNQKRRMSISFPWIWMCTSLMSKETFQKSTEVTHIYMLQDLTQWNLECYSGNQGWWTSKCHSVCYTGTNAPGYWTPLSVTTTAVVELFHRNIFQAWMKHPVSGIEYDFLTQENCQPASVSI